MNASVNSSDVKQTVKSYLLKEFLPGENPDELTDTTPLVTGGVLDSLATVKLVAFLEERYGIEFEPHEISSDYLDTLDTIADVVTTKKV